MQYLQPNLLNRPSPSDNFICIFWKVRGFEPHLPPNKLKLCFCKAFFLKYIFYFSIELITKTTAMNKKRLIYIGIAFAVIGLYYLTSSDPNAEREAAEEAKRTFKPKTSTKKLQAKSKTIKGELGDYLVLKNSTTEVNFKELDFIDNQVWEVKLNVLRTDKPLPYDPAELHSNYSSLGMTIFNKAGQPISGLNTAKCSGHQLIEAILSLKSGEDGWVTFDIYKGEKFDEGVIDDWSSFEVNSEIKFDQDVQKTSTTFDDDNSDYDNKSNASMSDDNFNQMMDDYEDYIDEYIKFYKKAMNGDLTALSNYPKMLEKAEAMDKSMSAAQGDMTAKQVARFLKIQLKLTNAALSGM